MSLISVNAQTIHSITYTPVNPTTHDTIYFYSNCSFNSGDCNPYQTNLSMIGDSVLASALHCLGPLTFICYYTDTFKVNPLPAGNYHFIFQVDEGLGGPPCTPGIVPGPVDSINFVVNAATSVADLESEMHNFSIYPKPVENSFHLLVHSKINSTANFNFTIYSAIGQKINTRKLTDTNTDISVSSLARGIYFCGISDEKNASKLQKLLISH